MTPEEAIRIIEVAQADCEWNAPLEYQEAFDAAIKALIEQSKHDQNSMSKQPDSETLGIKTGETCEDVISRQYAIDAILADKIDAISLKVMTALGDGRLALTLNDACDRHIRDIEKLPSAEPERKMGKWIEFDSDNDKYDEIKCNRCKKNFTVDAYHWTDIGFTKDDLKFCPNCGAYMEETNGKNV